MLFSNCINHVVQSAWHQFFGARLCRCQDTRVRLFIEVVTIKNPYLRPSTCVYRYNCQACSCRCQVTRRVCVVARWRCVRFRRAHDRRYRTTCRWSTASLCAVCTTRTSLRASEQVLLPQCEQVLIPQRRHALLGRRVLLLVGCSYMYVFISVTLVVTL